ncbi:MAG: LacI family DNA-binding transcriptional regulator [Pseudomonadota bacterium]
MTLQQVAAQAQVSPMTVSNFVNGKHHFMGAETKTRVAEAVAALNYRPDSAARGLRTARQRSIGMIVVDQSPQYLSDGFSTQVVSGLSNAVNAAGYTLQLEGLRPDQLAQSTLIHHVRTDGLCMMLSGSGSARKAFTDAVGRLNQPALLFLEKPKRGLADCCAVLQDDRRGGHLITRHLLERGARRFWLLKQSHTQWQAIREREKGVAQALAESGRTTGLHAVDCGSGRFEETQVALRQALTKTSPTDAIIAMNDQMGIAALKFLKSRGARIPQDIKITGFNAFDFWQYSDPLLTTIRSPGYDIGTTAGHEMIHRLKAGQFQKRSITLDVELIQGGTT